MWMTKVKYFSCRRNKSVEVIQIESHPESWRGSWIKRNPLIYWIYDIYKGYRPEFLYLSIKIISLYLWNLLTNWERLEVIWDERRLPYFFVFHIPKTSWNYYNETEFHKHNKHKIAIFSLEANKLDINQLIGEHSSDIYRG